MLICTFEFLLSIKQDHMAYVKTADSTPFIKQIKGQQKANVNFRGIVYVRINLYGHTNTLWMHPKNIGSKRK